MGGIAGYAAASLSGVHVDESTVRFGDQRTSCGGLVGSLDGKDRTEAVALSGSSFSGSIRGANTAEVGMGGLAGSVVSASISESYAVADIAASSASKSNVGGLVGTAWQANVSDCYAAGFVSNPNSTTAGGLVGASSEAAGDGSKGTTVARSYSSVALSTASTDSLRGLIGASSKFVTFENVYYDAQMAAAPHDVYGLATADMTTASGISGLDADRWMFASGVYPRLKANTPETDAAIVSATPLLLAASNDTKLVAKDFSYGTANGVRWKAYINESLDETRGHTFSFDGGTGRLNGSLGTDTLVVERGTAYKTMVLGIAPVPFKGEGTQKQPWLVGSKADLDKLSEISVVGGVTFSNKYIRQSADIDMGGAEFTPICKSGSDDLRFEGVYDGDGHKISNAVVRSVAFYEEGNDDGEPAGQVWPSNDDTYFRCGLFAIVGASGTVKNLTVDSSCKYDMYDVGGSIAGRLYGRVENCKNYATIKCYYSIAGGIVGELRGNGVVTGCFNAGSVYAGLYAAGGIVGSVAGGDATIENCANTGEVGAIFLNSYKEEGKQYTAGGIVGEATQGGTLRNVSNSGHVVSFKNVGGIIGNTKKAVVENAVNYGYVSLPSDLATCGAIIGAGKDVSVKGSYFDKKLNKTGAVSNAANSGVAALTATDFAKADLKLPEDVWQQTAGQYPMLKLAKDEEPQKLASLAMIFFDAADNIAYMHKPATLGNTPAVAWTVKHGDAFKVEGNSLEVTVPATGMANDTLIASYGASERILPLQSRNVKVLDGDGSEASPYIIANADDYLTLAAFVNESQFDYDGSFFKITADLDFSDKTFVPLADDGAAFNGVLDGDNHAVKNVALDVTEGSSTSNKGLIGTVGTNGLVRNIIVDESCTFKGNSNMGALVGHLYGQVDNVTNKAAVSGKSAVGGIAGYMESFSSITKSSNHGKVTGSSDAVGGIAGQSADKAEAVMAELENHGEVDGRDYVGGIAGKVSADFDKATNKAAVISDDDYVGGIVGLALYPTSVRKSHNEGDISKAYSRAGGIIGQAQAHDDLSPLVVDSTYNTAKIRTMGGGYTGGIIGHVDGGGLLLSGSYNTGDVNGSKAGADEQGNYAPGTSGLSRSTAGIVGEVDGKDGASSKVSGCYNSGRVIGGYGIGGVVGAFNGKAGTATIEGCHNTGEVLSLHSSQAYAGGVAGTADCNIADCWNSGEVMAYGDAFGGLAGKVSVDGFAVERSFNVGVLTAQSVDGSVAEKACHAGGIVGYGSAAVRSCYNFGAVSAYSDAAGLVGCPGKAVEGSDAATVSASYVVATVSVAKDGGEWSMIAGKNAENPAYGEAVDGAYFDTSFGSASEYDNTLTGVKGVTTKELTELDLGDDFVKATASYPSLAKQADNVVNNFHVATVVFADGQDAQNVLGDFLVGTPKGVEWSSSDNLLLDGNNVRLNNESVGEKATLTLTAGDLSRSYELVLNRDASGISLVPGATSKAVSRTLYDTTGRKVEGQVGAGSVLIEKTVYEDGTSTTRKIVVKGK